MALRQPRFRFYGVRPARWRELPGGGLAYDLAFVRKPDDVEQETLAVALEGALGGAAAAAGPWRWRDRWAACAIAPVRPPDGASWELARHVLWDRYFTAVADAMNALCDVVPLAQVVCAGAAAPSTGAAASWEAWSVARGPAQAAPCLDDAPVAPGFEAARAAARAAHPAAPWWRPLVAGVAPEAGDA